MKKIIINLKEIGVVRYNINLKTMEVKKENGSTQRRYKK